MDVTELLQYMRANDLVCLEFRGDDGEIYGLHGKVISMAKYLSDSHETYIVKEVYQGTNKQFKRPEIVIRTNAIKRKWRNFNEEMELCDLIAKLK